MTPRAITGVGVLSAAGTSFEDLARLLGGSAAPPGPVVSFDASKYESPALLEVPAFDATKFLGDKGLRTLDRLTKLLIVAARLCLHDASIKKDGEWVALGPERVGVCASNAYGSLEAITELDRVAVLEDARYINPAKFPNTVSNSAAGYVSIWEDLRALNVSVSDGNCGGLDAVFTADLCLANDRADVILTGGGEAMSEALFLAFEKIGALGGTPLGEGAAFLALEDAAKARARGAKVLAEITGYGTAFVAPENDATLLFASRRGIARAITQALADAGIAASDVDLVASSVAGVARFDDEELGAITEVLGGGVPIAAPKRLLGETLGAGGALGLTAAIAWLQGVPAGPLVRGSAPRRPRTILVTAVGYYGNASAVVLRDPG